MRFRFNFTLGLLALGLSLAVLVPTGAEGDSKNRGLTDQATQELKDAGVDKYLGKPYQELELLGNIQDLTGFNG